MLTLDCILTFHHAARRLYEKRELYLFNGQQHSQFQKHACRILWPSNKDCYCQKCHYAPPPPVFTTSLLTIDVRSMQVISIWNCMNSLFSIENCWSLRRGLRSIVNVYTLLTYLVTLNPVQKHTYFLTIMNRKS